MLVTLEIGDFVGMSEPVIKEEPDDEKCLFFRCASVRHRTKVASFGIRADICPPLSVPLCA